MIKVITKREINILILVQSPCTLPPPLKYPQKREERACSHLPSGVLSRKLRDDVLTWISWNCPEGLARLWPWLWCRRGGVFFPLFVSLVECFTVCMDHFRWPFLKYIDINIIEQMKIDIQWFYVYWWPKRNRYMDVTNVLSSELYILRTRNI